VTSMLVLINRELKGTKVGWLFDGTVLKPSLMNIIVGWWGMCGTLRTCTWTGWYDKHVN